MHQKKGIAILFAVLAIGLILGIGVAINSLTLKELLLSSIGKQSQVAFYAADTGAECARYWDIKHSSFSQVDDTTGASKTESIICAGQTLSVAGSQNNTSNSVDEVDTRFRFDIDSPTGFLPQYSYCADVSVQKSLSDGQMHIVSHGYNLPCGASYSSRKVERAVDLTY